MLITRLFSKTYIPFYRKINLKEVYICGNFNCIGWKQEFYLLNKSFSLFQMKTTHQRRRWECSFENCDQLCTTKSSLKRHIERYHSQPTSEILRGRKRSKHIIPNAELIEREFFGEELTDAAKMAKIRRLEKEAKEKDTEIERLKELNAQLEAQLNAQETTASSMAAPSEV